MSSFSLRWLAPAVAIAFFQGAITVQAQTRILGIDVAAWQTELSETTWATFKRPTNQQVGGVFGDGRDFAFIRSSRGGTTGTHPGGGPGGGGDPGTLSRRYDDPYFAQNITCATKAGMFAGAYHFGRADISGNTGGDEATHFLQMAKPWMRPGYLLPVFDLEAGNTLHDDASLSNFCNTFSDGIFNATGVRPIIYANTSYATSELESSVVTSMPNLWIARPSSGDPLTTEPPTPSGFSNPYGLWNFGTKPWKFWQYDTTGGLNGYSGDLDKDVANGGMEFVKDYLVPAMWTTDSSGTWNTLANWNSGAEPVEPVHGPGQVARVGIANAWTTAASTNTPAYRPTPRAPGIDDTAHGVEGENDTVILDRGTANPTITLSSGSFNIRKLIAREALDITGGSLTMHYVPVSESTPYSAQFSAAVSMSGGTLGVHTLRVDATRTFTISGGSMTLDTIELTRHSSLPAKIQLNGNASFTPRNGVAAFIENLIGSSGNSGVVDLGAALRFITVADGAAAVDLTIDVPVVNGGVFKLGAGTLALNGANTYAGDTVVLEGKLSLDGTTLNDAADVYVSGGATLDLNHSGFDLVDSLFLNGEMQDFGVWGGPGSGATYTSPLLEGLGVLFVSTGPPPGDFDRDNSVDGDDLTEWENNFGSEFDGADFLTWQRNIGATTATAATAPVPEPATAILLLTALGGLALVHRRRRG